MINFARIVRTLVWCSSLIAISFGIYHHLTMHDPFVLFAACLYIVVIVGISLLHSNSKLTSVFQLCLMINMYLNGFGTNGLYVSSDHYDDVVHFVSPFLFAYAAAAWQVAQRKPIWPAFVLVAAVSVGWEPLEMLLDHFFKTHSYGQINQPYDTLYDIVMDLSGIAITWLIFQFSHKSFLRWLNS